MTSVYEVETIHTKQVLKDFVTFREKVKNSRVDFQFTILGICLLAAVKMVESTAAFWMCLVLGILLLVFVAVRRPIAVKQLEKGDINYQTQSRIRFVFGESEFRVNNPDAEKEQRIRYAEVAFMYADDKYFYINVNNEDVHMFSKADFVIGDPEKFKVFIEEKTGQKLQPVKIPLKVKLQRDKKEGKAD